MPLRSVRPIATSSRTAARAFSQTARRRASPRIAGPDYNADPLSALFVVRRGIAYLLIGAVGTVALGAIGFEALHQYVESGPMGFASRGNDEWGWEDEVLGWTGGPNGGTDSRLGWKARHALRAAWMCQHWGAGGSSLSRRQGLFEPDYMAFKGMIGVDPDVVRPDRGYEMANGFFDIALEAARLGGMVFPSTLSVLRPSGPPKTTSDTQGDPAVVDMLLLKAGGLERIGTQAALAQAKELYERVVTSTRSDGGAVHEARVMRLATKVGLVCARLGDGEEALAWWGWGLERVGLELPTRLQEVKTEAKAWFGKAPEAQQLALPTSLPPPVLRATVSLLIAAATHMATNRHISGAASLQTTALRILPAPAPIDKPTPFTASATLHHTWIEQRSSLLALHLASTSYALGRPALNLASVAATRSDDVLAALTPIPSIYLRLHYAIVKQLQRNALLTAAEAAYTRGRLLERQPNPPLAVVADCYERAMSLDASESGLTEPAEMGREWQKYWDSHARVKRALSPDSP